MVLKVRILVHFLFNCESVSQSIMSDSATPWTVACQDPLSMGFSRQEYWSELPFPLDRDRTLLSRIEGRLFMSEPPGKHARFLVKWQASSLCTILILPLFCPHCADGDDLWSRGLCALLMHHIISQRRKGQGSSACP